MPPLAFESTGATVRLSAGATKSLQAELPLRLGAAERSLLVGVRAGYQSNLSALRTPTVGISVASRMRFISKNVYLGLEVGAGYNPISPNEELRGDTPINSSLMVPTGSLQLRYRGGVVGIDARYQHLPAEGALVRGNVGGFLASLRFDLEL